MQGRIAVAALMAIGALALPAVAGAKTKTVQVGPFGAKAKQFDAQLATGNEYYRRVITIHKGDSVRWKINGPHSVTFVPKGDRPPAVAIPDPSNPVAGSNDAAGKPFWFNGQPNFVPNPVALAPQGGKTFDASELQSSGLVLEGSPPPYKLRFKRKGTFNYLCVLHPGMAAKVKVVGGNRQIPSAHKDKRAAKHQLDDSLDQVRRLSAGRGTEILDKTILAGNDRRSGATVFKFFPAKPSFKVGDTVTLQMAPRSTELHTFTLGPSNGKDAYNDQLAANLLGPVFDPRGIYPSEPPPAGIPSYNGANHGNGFYNSGFLDVDAASPLPASTKVTFTAPGSYPLICLIHPFMTATVTVTP
jgi:plastocyanin